tara:strand:+ start:242 stop:589 length:348 start_codon:yes stop_codon:yes gene_type:complete
LPDYADIRNDVIKAIGSFAREGGTSINDLERFMQEHKISCPPGWADKIGHDLAKSDLGNAYFSDRVTFNPSGAIIATADELRAKETLVGKLQSINRSDWIALGAFFVSIFALFKD